MSKLMFITSISKRDFYYNGNIFFYRQRLGKNRVTKLKPIKSITLVRLILKNKR